MTELKATCIPEIHLKCEVENKGVITSIQENKIVRIAVVSFEFGVKVVCLQDVVLRMHAPK